ncbi:NAD(P)H-dependent oxidoreductase [Sporolactobacillus terrae]|uniref:NAD(P)H-dependent oxidoreductase n=1 Tax=Sporolactobacillus terrae TaxID=269673 RepID=UPI0004909AEF|nr:NAD(P)H-dependent oxidoreductase [Sporolactobacillus terrae]
MSKIVVIIGDPRKQGFNKALAHRYAKEMQEMDHQVELFDLHEMNFEIDMALGYQTKRSKEILHLEKAVERADLLVISFPVWWYNVPAKLKGLVDQLFWIGKAYSFHKKKFLFNGPWRGKKARLIYTLGGTELQHRLFGWSAYRAMRYPLWISGILSVKRSAIGSLDLPIRKSDNDYFAKIKKAAQSDHHRLRTHS